MSITDNQAAIIGEKIGQAIENEMTHGEEFLEPASAGVPTSFAEKLGAGIAKGLLPWASYTTKEEFFAEILGKSIGEAIGKIKGG